LDLMSASMKIIAELGDEKDAAFMKEKAELASGFGAISVRNSYTNFLIRQNEGVVAEGMDILASAARSDSQWYLRYSAMNNLESLRDGIQDRNEGPNSEAWMSSMVDRLGTLMSDIKAQETNPRLKSYWK
jgi:hypothetical protein